MKKRVILLLFISVILMGCSQNDSNQSKENQKETNTSEVTSVENNKDNQSENEANEIIDKFVDADDLDSYVLSLDNMDTTNNITTSTVGSLEMINSPKTYHLDLKINSTNKDKTVEEYYYNNKRSIREDNKEWNTISDSDTDEKPIFIADTDINPSSVLKPLSSFYDITESDDTYIAKLQSNSENIEEIKNIIFGGDDLSFGEFKSLNTKYTYSKDNYYPIDYEVEYVFFKDNNDIIIKNSGKYDSINKLDKIEIPDGIK